MTSNTKMVRDALGSPVPQTLNEDDNTYTVLASGNVTGIDFSKYKLLRDALGSPLPYQYFDTTEGKFVEGVLNGGSGGSVDISKIRNESSVSLRTEVVSSLPSSNLNNGRIVFNTADNTFRGYNGSEWL